MKSLYFSLYFAQYSSDMNSNMISAIKKGQIHYIWYELMKNYDFLGTMKCPGKDIGVHT